MRIDQIISTRIAKTPITKDTKAKAATREQLLVTSSDRNTTEDDIGEFVTPFTLEEETLDAVDTSAMGPADNGKLEAAEAVDSTTANQQITSDSSSSNVSTSHLIALAPNQANSLRFSIGCNVMFDLKTAGTDEHIQEGKAGRVTGAYINPTDHGILYEIKRDSQGGSKSKVLICKDDLAFAPGCPITYSESGSFEDFLYGKVLFCQTAATSEASSNRAANFSYTIMTFSNDQPDEFKIVKDTTPNQIRYNDTASTSNEYNCCGGSHR